MNSVGTSLLKGARQALVYAQGKKVKARSHKVMIPTKVDVKTIRSDLSMNRKEFCESFGFSLRTLEKWEQGIRQPEGPTRAYLLVIAHDPRIVERALASEHWKKPC